MKKAISVLLCLCLALSVFTVVPFAASAAEVDSEATGVDTAATRIQNGHQIVFFQFPDTVWGPLSGVKRNAKKWTTNVFCNYYAIYGNENEVKTRAWEAPSTSMYMDTAGSKTVYFDITDRGQGEMEDGAEYGILFSTKANAGYADLLQPNTDGYQTCDLYFNKSLLTHTYKVDEPAVVRENTANSQKIDYLAHSDNGVGAPLRKVTTLCTYIDGINPGNAPASLEMANALQTYLPNPVNEPSFSWKKIEPVLQSFGTTAQEVYDMYVERFGALHDSPEAVHYEHVEGVDDLKSDGTLKDAYRYTSVTTTTVENGVEDTKTVKYPDLDLVRERLNLPAEPIEVPTEEPTTDVVEETTVEPTVSPHQSGTTGSCRWTLDDDGTLTISGNGAMGNYSSKNSNGTYITTAPWGSNIKAIAIEDGVTSIGDYAFYGSPGLTSVAIPNSVTSIGNVAFYHCTGLTSITIPDSVTSIGGAAFDSCTGLTSVTIPNSVTYIGNYSFFSCTSLTSVTIPDSVTSIGERAFGYYYINGNQKVSGFTIYGKRGSKAQRYASDNGFIFVSEYCMVSGISNYCQAFAARKIEVGDTVAVTFKVPEDFTIVDIQWGMNYDKDMLELTGINSFDNEKKLVNPNAESYNVMGSYSNISTPAGVAKDDEFVTFNFTVKQEGGTTVDFNVVDMTIRIYGEDQILVENGEIKNICTHKTTRTIPGYPATCTQAGLTDEIVCAECEKVLIKAEAIPAKGHTPVADQGKAATCTETGLTEGSHCSVCNEVLVEQTEIPALGHLPIIDPYLAPTCTHEGHTAGSHCARCGEVYVASETIPKLPHTVVTDEAVEPSCGHTGLTEGSHCSVCGEVIVAQEVIPALTHQYEIVPAVPATYTKEGSTDGVRCKLCGEWLIEPQVIPKKPIDFVFGDVNEDGKVNIRDVTALQRFLAEYTDLTERQRGAADVNFDGVVDVRDATLLQMYFAEFDVQLG